MDISAAGYIPVPPAGATQQQRTHTDADGHAEHMGKGFAVAKPAQQDADQAGKTDKADKADNGLQLSPEEIKQLEKLKARDREVRAHEMAHLAAAGGLAMSGASFTYQRGPDGASYAIGGEVQIDTSGGSTPEETIRKAQIIRAAALAPAEPSGQDRSVAAKAAQMEAQARAEQASTDGQEEDEEQQQQSSQEQRINHNSPVNKYQNIATEFAASSSFSLQA